MQNFDLSIFGNRELKELGEILESIIKYGYPADFTAEEVSIQYDAGNLEIYLQNGEGKICALTDVGTLCMAKKEGGSLDFLDEPMDNEDDKGKFKNWVKELNKKEEDIDLTALPLSKLLVLMVKGSKTAINEGFNFDDTIWGKNLQEKGKRTVSVIGALMLEVEDNKAILEKESGEIILTPINTPNASVYKSLAKLESGDASGFMREWLKGRTGADFDKINKLKEHILECRSYGPISFLSIDKEMKRVEVREFLEYLERLSIEAEKVGY